MIPLYCVPRKSKYMRWYVKCVLIGYAARITKFGERSNFEMFLYYCVTYVCARDLFQHSTSVLQHYKCTAQVMCQLILKTIFLSSTTQHAAYRNLYPSERRTYVFSKVELFAYLKKLSVDFFQLEKKDQTSRESTNAATRVSPNPRLIQPSTFL